MLAPFSGKLFLPPLKGEAPERSDGGRGFGVDPSGAAHRLSSALSPCQFCSSLQWNLYGFQHRVLFRDAGNPAGMLCGEAGCCGGEGTDIGKVRFRQRVDGLT